MQHTVESPCPLSAPHPSISQMLTPSHAVESPCVPPYHLPRLLPYWRHVPPHSDQRNSLPFLSHFIPLASALYFYPIYTATAPPTSTWGFHVADAAHRGITMPSVCPTPFDISNAYPIPAPSSHWGFHVADARRGVTMCSALPPTSSLACTLYWRHVPLPAPSSHWGCHIADAARLPYFISCLHHVPLPPQVNLSTPSTLPWPRPCVLQPLNIHMGVPRSRCSTPWSHHALCLPHPL